MLTIRRILFPTDFSEGAAHAFLQAATLAERHDAELPVLNVTGPNSETETTLPVSSAPVFVVKPEQKSLPVDPVKAADEA
jgi:nucleotide-binding universal stress UspA family protein